MNESTLATMILLLSVGVLAVVVPIALMRWIFRVNEMYTTLRSIYDLLDTEANRRRTREQGGKR